MRKMFNCNSLLQRFESQRRAREGTQIVSSMGKPPDNIWLQFHGDGEPEDTPVSSDDVTWCQDKIYDHDIHYIKADALRRTADNARLAASMWTDSVDKLKRRALESFALELERIIAS